MNEREGTGERWRRERRRWNGGVWWENTWRVENKGSGHPRVPETCRVRVWGGQNEDKKRGAWGGAKRRERDERRQGKQMNVGTDRKRACVLGDSKGKPRTEDQKLGELRKNRAPIGFYTCSRGVELISFSNGQKTVRFLQLPPSPSQIKPRPLGSVNGNEKEKTPTISNICKRMKNGNWNKKKTGI